MQDRDNLLAWAQDLAAPRGAEPGFVGLPAMAGNLRCNSTLTGGSHGPAAAARLSGRPGSNPPTRGHGRPQLPLRPARSTQLWGQRDPGVRLQPPPGHPQLRKDGARCVQLWRRQPARGHVAPPKTLAAPRSGSGRADPAQRSAGSGMGRAAPPQRGGQRGAGSPRHRTAPRLMASGAGERRQRRSRGSFPAVNCFFARK